MWTTRSDGGARSPDLVERNFTAQAPNQLWVTDLTYVPTWSGGAYVAFIVDVYSRMIVGWRVAAHMRTDMVLDALNMAAWNRRVDLACLVTHSDAGSQFTSIRWTERLAEIGARPSIGSVADSYDNALAETVNGYYKAELIYGPSKDHGRPSTTSNSPPWHGCTGTTPSAFTATAATFHPSSSRPPTLPTTPTNNWLETNNQSLQATQGDSHPVGFELAFANEAA